MWHRIHAEPASGSYFSEQNAKMMSVMKESLMIS